MKLLVVIACIVLIAPVARADVEPQRIDAAIELGKKFLYDRQKEGNWERASETRGDQPTGLTAMAVYALLSSGESDHDPRILKAVEYLEKTPASGAFALGVRCQVWLLLPQTQQIKIAMLADAKILQSSVITQGEGRGFYPYSANGKGYSHSRAQFAVLGLWAAAQSGVEVPDSYWKMVEQAWLDCQDGGGGWAYQNVPSDKYPIVSDSTAGGVATLFITQDFLHADDAASPHGNIHNPHIDSGVRWLGTNIDKIVADDSPTREYPYSTLYTLERVGVASGLRFFKDVNWYDRGAEWLLKKQKKEGSWPAELESNVYSTSCAMLFLARGRVPLAMDKLDYSIAGARKEAPWNERPRDVANVSRFIGKQLEKEINWQIVNLSTQLDDWHDAPILYISGNEPLVLDQSAKNKLKDFIEQGGTVVGNADGEVRGFSASLRRLGQELFPAYEFRELPADHVIYTGEQFRRANWKIKLSTLGLSNGVREMILLPQADLARSWQTQSLAGHEEQWQLASNIFLYATESQNLRKRGETYLVKRDENIKATRTIKIARLKYAGNWNPEPQGWLRLANLFHNQRKIDLQVEPVNLVSGSLDDVKIAHLTGTDKIKISDEVEAKLKKFVEGGGTLIIDAAGGSPDFAGAMEKELATMFDGKELTGISRDHEMFSIDGATMKTFSYRPFSARVLGQLKNEPRLKGIEVNGRFGVIFSREDLSAALVGEPMDGIVGYDPATASEMMSRILVYAAGGKP